jgi:hypothetical protein
MCEFALQLSRNSSATVVEAALRLFGTLQLTRMPKKSQSQALGPGPLQSK